MELDRAQLYRAAYLRSVAPDAMRSLEDGIADVMLGKQGAVISAKIPIHEYEYIMSVIERYLVGMGYAVKMESNPEISLLETKPNICKITIHL